MSKLDELIKELCPNGVEYKKLGDISDICRGASPRPIKNFITDRDDGVNWIKIGDVKSGDKYITSCAEKITKEGAEKSRKVYKGDFILSNSMSFGRPY
ncbi:restriction endonuclease subunit S, partial [Clostridium perfringens]